MTNPKSIKNNPLKQLNRFNCIGNRRTSIKNRISEDKENNLIPTGTRTKRSHRKGRVVGREREREKRLTETSIPTFENRNDSSSQESESIETLTIPSYPNFHPHSQSHTLNDNIEFEEDDELVQIANLSMVHDEYKEIDGRHCIPSQPLILNFTGAIVQNRKVIRPQPSYGVNDRSPVDKFTSAHKSSAQGNGWPSIHDAGYIFGSSPQSPRSTFVLVQSKHA